MCVRESATERSFVAETASAVAMREPWRFILTHWQSHMLRVDARRTYPRSVKHFRMDRAFRWNQKQYGLRFCRRDKPQGQRNEGCEEIHSYALEVFACCGLVLGAHTRAPLSVSV